MKENYYRIFESEETSTISNRVQSAPKNEPNTGKKALPLKEYLRFIKLWDIIELLSDITIIAGNIGLELQVLVKETMLICTDSKNCQNDEYCKLRFFNLRGLVSRSCFITCLILCSKFVLSSVLEHS